MESLLSPFSHTQILLTLVNGPKDPLTSRVFYPQESSFLVKASSRHTILPWRSHELESSILLSALSNFNRSYYYQRIKYTIATRQLPWKVPHLRSRTKSPLCRRDYWRKMLSVSMNTEWMYSSRIATILLNPSHPLSFR